MRAVGRRCDCDHAKPLRRESNILVLVRLNELKVLSHINFWLAIASVVYFGENVVCTVLNSYERGIGPEYVTTDETFHTTEFGATFLFAIIEVMSIIYSPDRQFELPVLLNFLVFWNVAASFIPAMLVFINLEKFEVLSHEMEYTNGLAMAAVDMLMALQLCASWRQPNVELGVKKEASSSECSKVMLVILLGVVPISVTAAQLGVYNGMGIDANGEHKGEQAAHYLEFAFEMISAVITFWFCMDNKIRVDTMRLDIMLAEEDEQIVMNATRSAARGTEPSVARG